MSDASGGGLDRMVVEDRRPMAEDIKLQSALQSARPGGMRFGAQEAIDPKLTRRPGKMPVEQVADFLQKMAAAIAENQSLIVHSKLPNSIKFQAIKVSEEKTLPTVVLPGQPFPREIEQGTRTRSDTFCELTPAALERLLGDYCFLDNLDSGLFEIVPEVPVELRDPLSILREENADLRARLDAVEQRLHPKAPEEKEADRRAALSDEEREKEDADAVAAARIRRAQA